MLSPCISLRCPASQSCLHTVVVSCNAPDTAPATVCRRNLGRQAMMRQDWKGCKSWERGTQRDDLRLDIGEESLVPTDHCLAQTTRSLLRFKRDNPTLDCFGPFLRRGLGRGKYFAVPQIALRAAARGVDQSRQNIE